MHDKKNLKIKIILLTITTLAENLTMMIKGTNVLSSKYIGCQNATFAPCSVFDNETIRVYKSLRLVSVFTTCGHFF